MGDLRPGTKIRFWNPGYRNRPDVRPPGLLLLVAVLSLFSAIGVLIFAVVMSLRTMVGTEFEAQQSIYIAIMHFILPIGITYSVSTNSSYSKYLILSYIVVLFAATLAGIGFLGHLEFDGHTKRVVATGIFLAVLLWLVASPKMRLYYALLSGNPVPDDLQSRIHELAGKSWLGPNSRRMLDWAADNLETIVLLGFIAVALYAVYRTGN